MELNASMANPYFQSVISAFGGPSRNRTGVDGFANRCVTTPPSGLSMGGRLSAAKCVPLHPMSTLIQPDMFCNRFDNCSHRRMQNA